MINSRLAAWLRKIADRLSPVPPIIQAPIIYPAPGEIPYRGEVYKLEVIKSRQYYPRGINTGFETDRRVRRDIMGIVYPSVEVRDCKGFDGDEYAEGELLILTKKQ